MPILSKCIQVKSIKSGEISCILVLSDGRIATATGNKKDSICITSIDLVNKKYIRDIKVKKVHDHPITTLCELNKNRLLSGSYRKMIIWELSMDSLIAKLSVKAHLGNINKIILINNRMRWISCSDDKSMKVWDNAHPYVQHKQLKQTDEYPINALIELKHSDFIVASSSDGWDNGHLIFFDPTSFSKISIIDKCYTNHSNGMIELPNGCIALSQRTQIIIINVITYNIITRIHYNSSHTRYSLSVFDQHSFISVSNGQLIRISTTDNNYNIINKEKLNWEDLTGESGVIVLNECSKGNKLILSSNYDKGFNIIKYECQ